MNEWQKKVSFQATENVFCVSLSSITNALIWSDAWAVEPLHLNSNTQKRPTPSQDNRRAVVKLSPLGFAYKTEGPEGVKLPGPLFTEHEMKIPRQILSAPKL